MKEEYVKGKYYSGDAFKKGRIMYILLYQVVRVRRYIAFQDKEIYDNVAIPMYKFAKYKKKIFSETWKKVSSNNPSSEGFANTFTDYEIDMMISDGWIYKPYEK